MAFVGYIYRIKIGANRDLKKSRLTLKALLLNSRFFKYRFSQSYFVGIVVINKQKIRLLSIFSNLTLPVQKNIKI